MSRDSAGDAGSSLPDGTGAGGAPGGEGSRAAGSSGPGEEEARESCELCGGPTIERHCKIVCLRCGYTRDCSDP